MAMLTEQETGARGAVADSWDPQPARELALRCFLGCRALHGDGQLPEVLSCLALYKPVLMALQQGDASLAPWQPCDTERGRC